MLDEKIRVIRKYKFINVSMLVVIALGYVALEYFQKSDGQSVEPVVGFSSGFTILSIMLIGSVGIIFSLIEKLSMQKQQ